MPIDTTATTTASPLAVAATMDPAAQAAQRQAANDAARAAEVAEIKEKGFSTYVKELEEEKIERMREEILEAMGLNEEALEDMPAEQRSAIEKTIAEEIQRRLTATSQVNNQGTERENSTGGQAVTALSGSIAAGQDTLRLLQDVGSRSLGEGPGASEDEEALA